MPIYEYECRRCEHRFELLQRFDDKPARKCPECGGRVDRLIGVPAIRFKGTGWYVTDYAGKGKEREKAAGDGADGPDEPAGKGAAGETDKKAAGETKKTKEKGKGADTPR